ncbi:MAG: vWA domain-containing protein [Persicimonas sp.]
MEYEWSTWLGTFSGSKNFTCSWCRSNSDCWAAANPPWPYSLTGATYKGYNYCGTTYKTLWQIAKDAIDALVFDMTAPDPDDVRFGIGLFYNSTARIFSEAKENNHSSIMNVLNSHSPSGGTPMAKAIRTTRNSSTIQNAAGGSAGVLLTDGVPSSSRDDTIKAACEHRNDAPLHVVGFGGGTDEDFNNVLAAAGGTGSCNNGGDPCKGWRRYSAWYWDGKCDGSVQANNETELQNALNDIGEEISCTFNIEDLAEDPNNPIWDESRQGCTNYDCLEIRLNGSVNSRIYHKDSAMSPKGWEWSSSAHTQIRLLNVADGGSANYCQKLRDGKIVDHNEPDIDITRACMCTQNTGGTCGATQMVPPPATCECPVGTWTCQQGSDVCQPRNNNCPRPKVGEGGECTVGVGACERTGAETCFNGTPYCDVDPGDPEPEVCDGTDNNCDGIVDNVPWDGTERCHVDHGRDQTAIDNETVRCKLGTAACAGGSESCEPLDPMPEVCNGLDDDCDGTIDNLRGTWTDVKDENNQPYSLPQEYKGATCNGRDVCSCPDGPDDIEGDDFTSYIEGWANDPDDPNPDCLCGGSLSY